MLSGRPEFTLHSPGLKGRKEEVGRETKGGRGRDRGRERRREREGRGREGEGQAVCICVTVYTSVEVRGCFWESVSSPADPSIDWQHCRLLCLVFKALLGKAPLPSHSPV